MKKLIITALALTLTFALAACSGEQTKIPDRSGSSTFTQSENSSGSAEDAATIQSYMGQVSDKVGNDIAVSLGEMFWTAVMAPVKPTMWMKMEKPGRQMEMMLVQAMVQRL